ncbi:biopolymer transporter ExbB [Salipiger bermudensis]|uniref:biopolymer transporter ExbB n=1 Tax=Salipiger bermudensis TaxID=344736 RepID=UPI001CD34717|nr:biopolymer transporter ExbB [Salipiger bermudensis]MCA0963563.1 biopolymer transporter ExbB [Salipiger bermudensis]
MHKADFEAEPHFSQPFRQIAMMLAVLGLCGAGGFVALPRVLPVIEANPWLNGFIIFVFFLGVIACFLQVAQLIQSVRWIEQFVTDRDAGNQPPRLLAPLAALLRRRDRRLQITTSSTRSILDSVATRIDEAREITRYLVSLLIFLGLLGTFYGLATTVPALVDTIRSLAPSEGETNMEVFTRLMSGLESQLGGMGVAFASSLLGLAGSLIVGLLELFAGHGQNRFYRELEEWLSTITKLSFSSDGEQAGDTGIVEQVLDQMTDQMERLTLMFSRAQEGQNEVDARLGQLADSVERMTERLEATAPSANSLARIAEGQERLAEVLAERETSEGLDAESRMRLRSIDVQMLRLLEEVAAGRQESMAELRTDLAALNRTLTKLSHAPQGQPQSVTFRPSRPGGSGGAGGTSGA